MALRQSMRLTRDTAGVVHLRVRDEADLYHRIGYCHGHDRALQLLLMRILVSGRACELLHDDDETLVLDRWFRRVELGRDIDDEITKLSPEDQALADAYCAGINEALARKTPWELRLLRYRPEPWTVADSILIHRAMGYVQTGQHQADMERLLVEMIQAGVARDRLEEVFPGRLDGLDVDLLRRVRLGERLVPTGVRWAATLPPAVASNNWAIAPSRTRSGKAILASDPHLEVNRLPAMWYETVFELDEQYGIIATIPGLPLPAIGRTNHLAWGATYGCMDMVDSWIEDCRDGRCRRQAAHNDLWAPFRTRTEVIKRKRHADITLTFFENDHGVLDGDPSERGLYLCTRWAGHGTGAATLAAGFALLRAAQVAQGTDAVGRIETSWNWVLADSAGHIGYQLSGRMPLRPQRCSGLVPLPGWDPDNDWSGFAAPDDLPRAHNPDAGYLASSNNDLNHLGVRRPVNLPMGQDRAARIAELLGARSDWTLDAVHDMHMDVYSKQAERFMAILAPLLPSGAPAYVLRNWDCRYDPDSHGADVFERFYRHLLVDVFSRICGPEVARYILAETATIPGLFSDFDRALLDERSGWYGAGGRDTAFRAAADRALAEPSLAWSDRQRFSFRHLMFGGRYPRWLGFDRGPYPLPGGRATINNGQRFRQGGRETSWAPSYRFSTDFAEPAAHTSLAGGPSDRRFSRWYANEITDWLAARTKRLAPRSAPTGRTPRSTPAPADPNRGRAV